MSQPIKVYSHVQGPNPWKVIIILEELGVPYESEMVEFSKIKSEPFISVNPNGRVPAIEDPNTGVTLWESGAIVSYLIDTYDKEHKLSYTSSPEKYHLQQWAMFQMSGQGPYFGQAVWFTKYHPEKIPSAVERYVKEMERVISVLDLQLSRNKGSERWLVGDKCTYADLMFIPWFVLIPLFDPEAKWAEKYPQFQAWLENMRARPAVKKAADDQAKLIAAQAK